MSDEAAEPRRIRGQALIDATREDLDFYAIEELEDRILTLKGEIARAQAQIDRKQSGRAAADALFKR
jgi:uncharacterized small protein (DUF1192 family)